jgi:hypothetical protein
MNLKQTIINFLEKAKPKPKVNKPTFAVELHHPVIFAFESGDIKYYQFQDIFQLCHSRAFRAMEVYEEAQMRTTKEMLLLHVEATDKILTSDKIDIFAMKKLNDQLKERLEFIISSDTIWKLASVVFFDEKENPYDYDYRYGIEKIKLWKKEKDVANFFLNTPINKLLPYLDMSENDLRTYISVGQALTKQQIENLSQYTSKTGQSRDLFKTLELLN